MIEFRDANEKDIPFIMNSWLKSYYPFSERAPEPRYYFAGQRKILERTLEKATILVACNGEDKEQIFGYIVYDERANYMVYHWAFVKFSYRNLGIAKGLIEKSRNAALPVFYTHKHRECALGRAIGADYNPYLLYGDL